MISSIVERERNRFLSAIRSASSPYEAVKILSQMRLEIDWSLPDYRNSLSVISDTTYQDRKHFLLELIQNADDANFTGSDAAILFTIHNDGIELHYNEEGFSLENVIAITGTGNSTKVSRKKSGRSFIGEKGIGFKSVFALAKEVEIDSPPFHFKLLKEKPVVPIPLNNSYMSPGDGTRIRVRFSEPHIVDDVANEIMRYVKGEIESFLFLQSLASFCVEDKRRSTVTTDVLNIDPPDRTGSNLTISTSNGLFRKYAIYNEDVEFSSELVAKRWEGVRGPLHRTVSVAALANNSMQTPSRGRLFCFLPTKVTLPVPVYLHIDGATTANREKLHDLKYNEWNSYLVGLLPDLLTRAILSFRDNPDASDCLPDYVPLSEEVDQLAEVFKNLMDKLVEAPWIKTSDPDMPWVAPKDAIIGDKLIGKWIQSDPSYRRKVEEYLGKKFIDPSWAENKKWDHKWTIYGIDRLGELHIARILAHIPLPLYVLNIEDNLKELYQYLLTMKAINRGQRFHNDLIELLRTAKIFPFPKSGFGAIVENGNETKTFFISTRSQRNTGIEESMEYRIVDSEYTYRAEAGGSAGEQRREEIKRINARNSLVRDLLEKLEVPELNDETLFTDLQIPWLLNVENAIPSLDKIRFDLLKAMFDVYRSKREYDSEYRKQIRLLGEAYFPDESGEYRPLQNMTLPRTLRTDECDTLFVNCGYPTISIPSQLLLPPDSHDARQSNSRQEERAFRLRENWRNFLMMCGIRVKPEFILVKLRYDDVNDFRNRDYDRFIRWVNEVGSDYTPNNSLTAIYLDLDSATTSVLKKGNYDKELMAKSLYNTWSEKHSKHSESKIYSYQETLPGQLLIEYKRNYIKRLLIEHNCFGNVPAKLVPLKTISGQFAKADNVFRIKGIHKNNFPLTKDYINLVVEDDKTEYGYKADYLSSLNIKELSVIEINSLWRPSQKIDHNVVLQIIIEYIKAGYPNEGLQLLDRTTGRLLRYNSFRMGSKAAPGVPLIEAQYGNLGRLLGELLNLPSESKTTSYRKLLSIIFDNLPKSMNDNVDDIYQMLKDWKTLGDSARSFLCLDYRKRCKSLARSNQIYLCLNDSVLASKLRQSGYLVFELYKQETEVYELNMAAKELGLKVPEVSGQLIVEGEVPLSDTDRSIFIEYFKEYTSLLEEIEKSRLSSRLSVLGDFNAIQNQIIRVQRAYREIDAKPQTIVLPLDIPFLDKQGHSFYVGLDSSPMDILARLLSSCEFTTYRSALNELKGFNICKQEEVRVNRFQDISDDFINDPSLIAGKIKDGFVDQRSAVPKQESLPTWYSSFTPDEEEAFRSNQMDSFMTSLESGPETYVDKAKRHNRRLNEHNNKNMKFIDPGANDPKSFLNAEYRGKCQICSTELVLSNGGKWINVYHISEKKGNEWLTERPFNILGLCPNCHALAKHGGGRDLSNIYTTARDLIEGWALPHEIEEFQGDYYVIPIRINGQVAQLYMSKRHLNYFAVLFQADEEVAATSD